MPTARQALEIEAMARLAKARRAALPTPEMPYVEQWQPHRANLVL
jgi:hypothetical protein